MPSTDFTESVVEHAALSWFEALGYQIGAGPDLAPDGSNPERADHSQVVLTGRLRDALVRVNPAAPADALGDAFRQLTRTASPDLTATNRVFHSSLVNGVSLDRTGPDGRPTGLQVKTVDFDNPDNNDWLVLNQLTVVENKHNRRPDLVVFLNGLPIALFELKDPTSPQATIWSAFNQLQTYKLQIPSLLAFNELLVISDGLETRVGSLTSDKERFTPWRTVTGDDLAPVGAPQLQVAIEGLFEKRRLLDYLRHFVVFEQDPTRKGHVHKKLAAYHQFHAVRRAVAETVRATETYTGTEGGDHRVGVIWHTQGSGKSLTMAFYAGSIVAHPRLENPTLVLLTDRNDLDDQLFGTFARCQDLLAQEPVQAEGRDHLKRLLAVPSGGVIFTTIQKFLPDEKGARFPLLSARRNVVVIADEAHRSQYDFIDGFARHLRDALPNASFIGFTGTPIDLDDRSTRAVFGDYISVYDIQQAVEDKFTVPIYYEGRLAKIGLDEARKALLDPEFDEVTEGEETTRRERLRSKWAALEAIVGTDRRLSMIATDLVDHFEKRLVAMDGKAMIVCMSRRICVELYDQLVRLRPAWHQADDDRGAIKVVMTGSAADEPHWQPHIRNKQARESIAARFKDPDDPLKIVIVRDMWLTGFDVPPLHTMYVDKPMRGHGLMQAIARVNRVFGNKPGGLIVDFLGLGDQLRRALSAYTQAKGRGAPVIDQREATALFLEKFEATAALFHRFDYAPFKIGQPADRLARLAAGIEHILSQQDGKARLLRLVADLSKAFALAVPAQEALDLRDDVAFFQAVRSALAKTATLDTPSDEALDHAVRQLVSQALMPQGVVDIFTAAGLERPDISILSDEFLAEVRDLPHKNLAVEALERLLEDSIATVSRKRLVEGRSFREMLEQSLRAYHNRAIETAQVIEQLIQLAKDMRAAHARGEQLGLTEAELAFYDALETNDSAVKVLGDDTLRTIARELVETVRRNTTIDWNLKESARARLRAYVKRILRRYGYPPDLQERATQTVLEQAELLSEEFLQEDREALEEKVAQHRPKPKSIGIADSGHTDTARRAGEERPVPRPWR